MARIAQVLSTLPYHILLYSTVTTVTVIRLIQNELLLIEINGIMLYYPIKANIFMYHL